MPLEVGVVRVVVKRFRERKVVAALVKRPALPKHGCLHAVNYSGESANHDRASGGSVAAGFDVSSGGSFGQVLLMLSLGKQLCRSALVLIKLMHHQKEVFISDLKLKKIRFDAASL